MDASDLGRYDRSRARAVTPPQGRRLRQAPGVYWGQGDGADLLLTFATRQGTPVYPSFLLDLEQATALRDALTDRINKTIRAQALGKFVEERMTNDKP